MTSRRDFLKGVAAAGTLSGIAAQSQTGRALAQAQMGGAAAALPSSSSFSGMEAEPPEGYSADEAAHYFVQNPASDFMVDVIRNLGIDYITANPASSYRGLQESIVNYAGNKNPEFVTCLHEETAIAMGHGYAKIAYKPLAMLCHGTVGLQHASMAIYNAYADHVPLIIFGGNHLDAADRRPGAEWSHAAQDCAKLVRDFTKWDDTPVSLAHFAESLTRAYKIATTPPMGPVMITLDGHLQEMEVGDNRPAIPEFRPTVPSQGELGALREVAQMLVNAERPVIMAGSMARTPEGMKDLVELAEVLQIPVSAGGGRMNFPNDHHLYQSGRLVREADVVLGLEVGSFWRTVWSMRDLVHRETRRVLSPDVKLISLGLNDVYLKANYQNFQRYQPVDLSIAGDAQASLPALIEEVKRAMTAQRRSQNAAREDEFRRSHQESRTQARKQAAYGWNSSPVSTTRLMVELGQQIKDRDWSLVGPKLSGGARRFWTMNKHYQYIGGSGAGGLGYGAPASVGAALANREHGRLSVSVVADGDFMYSSGALWTATHHDIPLLMVINNNRAYHQEVMHVQRIAARRQRGVDGPAKIGNVFENPYIDYAALARSMGVSAEGPISDPTQLAGAFKRAVDVVEQGGCALVDVVCQPR